jgi:hypothetical protein
MTKWMCTMCGGTVDDPPPDHHEDHACDWINVTLAYRAGQEEMRERLWAVGLAGERYFTRAEFYNALPLEGGNGKE